MELRHLRYLVAIADAGTFVRAAEHLRVAQPALTRQIHDLEKELGVELFDGKARKATLTPAGDVCARLARHVIQDTEQAVTRARLSNSGVAGRCVIVCGPVMLFSGLMPRLVARLRARYPGITVVIRESVGTSLWDEVISAEADIGIGVSPPKPDASLMVETQYIHRVNQAVLPTGHASASKTEISLAELRDFPLLMIEDISADLNDAKMALAHAMQRAGFPAASLTPREFPSFESVIAHVRAGQGWTIVPELMANRIAGVATVTFTDFIAPFRTTRMWRAADTRPVVQTVLREMRAFEEEERQSARAGVTPPAAARQEANEFMPTRLDLRHLRSFIAVARHGSLGRAAEALEVTQPALSRQMRELEYDVGVPLLDRQTRGMALTAAGDGFVGDVRSVLSVVDHVPREVRRAVRGSAQRCVVGTVPHPYAERIVGEVVKDLESRVSRVRVGTRLIHTPLQADALRNGDIDVGISHALPVPAPQPVAQGLVVLSLFDDRISTALLATNHPLASAPALRLGDLAEVPFMFPARKFFPRFYDAVVERFEAAGIRPRMDAEFDGLATIWALAAQGMGWALGWQSHRNEPPPGLRAVPLEDFSMSWGGNLAYRQDESRAPVLATIDTILAHAREMYHVVSAREAVLPTGNTSEASIS